MYDNFEKYLNCYNILKDTYTYVFNICIVVIMEYEKKYIAFCFIYVKIYLSIMFFDIN